MNAEDVYKIYYVWYSPAHLIEYGIQTEDSTHRVHIDAKNNWAFEFRTEAGIAALPPDPRNENGIPVYWENDDYYLLSYLPHDPSLLGDGRFATARGTRLLLADIDGCKAHEIPKDILLKCQNLPQSTTSERGRKGEKIYELMRRDGIFILESGHSMPATLGADFIEPIRKVEVKWDWNCLVRGLFLQTHEWNPYRQH